MTQHFYYFIRLCFISVIFFMGPMGLIHAEKISDSEQAETLELWGKIESNNHILTSTYLENAGAQYGSVDNSFCGAVAQGQTETIQTLLEQGADPNAVDSLGVSALSHATLAGNEAIAEYLLTAGAEINKQGLFGVTPIMLAVNRGDAKMVRFLLKHGANPSIANADGEDALTISQRKNFSEVTDVLQNHVIESGSKLTKRTETEQGPDLRSELSLPSVSKKSTDTSTNELLKAVRRNDFDLARQLLEQGVNPNIKQSDGTYPLMIAAAEGNIYMTKLLFRHDTVFDSPSVFGMTPLMIASQNGHTEVVRLLLNKGANPSLQNDFQQDAYTLASLKGRADILQLLDQHTHTPTAR